MESLDNILRREPASVQETQEQTTQTAETTTEGAAEQTTEQQTETTEGEQTAESGKPPIGAIRQAEREKATKRYTEQVADFDKRLSEQNEAWERRFTKLLETVKPPQQQQQQPPDFFENPNGAVLHTVAPQMDEFRGVMMHNSRLIAEGRHGEDLVQSADAAFTQAYEGGKLDPADYQRVIRSPNIYDAAVKWHQRQKAIEEIGPDPSAYRERLKAELMAELGAQGGQQQNGGQQQQAAPVMPSNLATARNVGARSGPAWGGPKSLNDIFKR